MRLPILRLDEIAVLQGPPLMGALLAGQPSLTSLMLLIAGNGLLVAHVFALNDLAGQSTDARDPARTGKGLAASGLSRGAMMGWIVLLLAGAMAVLFWLGGTALLLGLSIGLLSGLYSTPPWHWKAVPIAGSLLHLAGGAAHFLLGYASQQAIDARGLGISLVFGMIFTAGHLSHEVRDHEVDAANGIRTNAVAFGRQWAFLAGTAMFVGAYGLMAILAFGGILPAYLIACLAFIPLHLLEAARAWRAGLARQDLLRLQARYRCFFGLIGAGILAGVLA